MNYRDYLQQLIYKIINPLIRGMIKIGITPNFITTTGFVLNVVAAGMFVYAGIDDFLWYLLLFINERLFPLCTHCICGTNRLTDGKLCACPCRRLRN